MCVQDSQIGGADPPSVADAVVDPVIRVLARLPVARLCLSNRSFPDLSSPDPFKYGLLHESDGVDGILKSQTTAPVRKGRLVRRENGFLIRAAFRTFPPNSPCSLG